MPDAHATRICQTHMPDASATRICTDRQTDRLTNNQLTASRNHYDPNAHEKET